MREGRAAFLRQFPSLAGADFRGQMPDPADPGTFERCKLDHSEREKNREIYELHRDLLQLRREQAAFRAQRPRGLDGAVLSAESMVLRYFDDGGEDRLLLINLGRDLDLAPAPEPLLAPPADMDWAILWSSEHPRYGGGGTAPLDTNQCWKIPGHAAVILQPVRALHPSNSMVGTKP